MSYLKELKNHLAVLEEMGTPTADDMEYRKYLIVSISDEEKLLEKYQQGFEQAMNDYTGQDLDVFHGEGS